MGLIWFGRSVLFSERNTKEDFVAVEPFEVLVHSLKGIPYLSLQEVGTLKII
jgi:hypothetical protein